MMRVPFKVTLTVTIVLALCGCGARRSVLRRTGAGKATVTGSSSELFTPSSYIAQRTLAIGSRYPDLLSPDSYAIWFTDEVAQLKSESELAEDETSRNSEQLLEIAKRLNQKYLILECHVVSAFPDSGIAYDITSFRHADVFLLDDAGNRHEPLQVIIGTLERANKGALKVFRRVNLLIFPKYDLVTGEPAISSHGQDISLVITCYETTYFFSWSELSETPRRARTDRQLRDVRAMTLHKLQSVLRFLVENLQ